jgi:hypothetical protein
MEFCYHRKDGAYQPHLVWASAIHPPPSTAATTVGTSATAPNSPPVGACSPPLTSRYAPSAAPESSRAATHRGKK